MTVMKRMGISCGVGRSSVVRLFPLSVIVGYFEKRPNVMKLLLILLFTVSCSQLPIEKKKVQKPSPYPRLETGIKRICGVSQEQDGYEDRYIFDCKEDYSPESRIFAGFGFRSKAGHPYTSGVRSPYGRGKAARSIDMISRNHSLNETYLYIIDFAGGPDSHDFKSVIFLIPRTDLPQVNVAGNEVELTLPTGEKVSFDEQSGAIKSGVLKEGPLDLRSDRMKRAEPNVHYTGEYISIRLNHRFEEPTIASDFAEIRQKENSCRISRGKLFSKDGKLFTKSDDELLAVLNRECPTPFSF